SSIAAAPLTGEVVHSTTNSDSAVNAGSGFAIHEFYEKGVLIGEAIFPSSSLIESGRIYAEVNGKVNTRLVMVNPDDQPVQISFLLADQDGNLKYGSTSIGVHGQLTELIDEAPFEAPPQFIGALTFVASKPVSVTAVRVFTNERDELLLSPLPVSDL